ncbi:hypothetical protein KDD17_13900 [Sulfitobacter albidus]|uniref:Uncharacterized protein n=1 Tax=Sulfitobacter albidus TaxID=2829501 RepID=A0A975PLP9_9RHOB|nr:hypothetical protein [Sulfitobacter albidus]QUJ76007.1 hypothetical protein KDD17_13900 [Sulfitobacter albidus]
MSDPYVIWTMRRTGGTTLATLLSLLSEHPRVQHEPFNKGRKFGDVYPAFLETGDTTALRGTLLDLLADRPVIKHCHELMNHAFNSTLMQVTTELGYRHIVLDRRSETDRLLSLELAQLTGAWGGDAAAKLYPAIEAGEVTLDPINMKHASYQMELCQTRRAQLAAMTAQADPAPFVIYFEDVYTDPERGRALIERLLAFLGIDPQAHPDYENLMEDALLRRGQNSFRIATAVPGFAKDRARLQAMEAKKPKIFVSS